MTPEPETHPAMGTRMTFRWRKWDGSPHWQHECYYLGSDQWGDWFGQPAGSHSFRPGRDVIIDHADITLMPPSGDYALTMNAPPHRTRVYIDVAWDVRWSDDGEPSGIDMDLDVVDHELRGVYIDDRDEWEDHREKYGYPTEVRAHLEALTLDLERRVAAHEAPFDPTTAARWFDVLAQLPDSPSRASQLPLGNTGSAPGPRA